jgi:hypothetical protein
VGGGSGVPSGVSGSSERNGRGRAAIESTRRDLQGPVPRVYVVYVESVRKGAGDF